jgi:hypothetical protein
MKTTAPLLPLTLLLLLTAGVVYSQSPLRTEQKKALPKLDPTDIFPVAQERAKTGKKPAPVATPPTRSRPAAPAGESAARRSVELEKAPTPALTASEVAITPAVLTAAPPPVQSAPLPTPTNEPAPTVTPSRAPAAPSATPTPVAAPPTSKVAGTTRLSLPVIFALLGVTVLALIVVVVKLKKQLRAL